MTRRFSEPQRTVIFIKADGRCQLCGEGLDAANFHADHITPYRFGGKTTIENGQALCPACNLTKGGFPLRLRQWQERAIEDFERCDKGSFLCVATPGAGKTTFTLSLLEKELGAAIDFVIVVAPSVNLRRQWADAASEFGIQIDPDPDIHNWQRNRWAVKGYDGIAVTYALLGSAQQRESLRMLARSRRCAVVLDEIHHAGTELNWGDGLLHAFGSGSNVAFRLCLSGTPFRNDNRAIPFVEYDSEGRSIADFSYGYGEALRDGVCLPVFFPSFDGGDVTWERDGDLVKASFDDDADEQQSRDRLRTFLSLRCGGLPSLLRKADEHLHEIRRVMPSAGGLVICPRQKDARLVAEELRKITGSMPTLAISEESDSSESVEQFSKSHLPWMVSVRMVSEGVDIPRLKMGVFASNIMTELFFRQFVGRFVRVDKATGHEDVPAHVYLPADPILCGYAETIAKERVHALDDSETKTRDLPEDSTEIPESSFSALSADCELERVIYNDGDFAAAEMAEANGFRIEAGLSILSDYDIAKVLRLQRSGGLTARHEAQPNRSRDAKTASKQVIHLVAALARVTGMDHQAIHSEWIDSHGGRRHADKDPDDMRRKVEWLEGRLRNARRTRT